VIAAAPGAAEWSIEMGAPFELYRGGWRPTILKPGDKVTVVLNPTRDGSNAGLYVSATGPAFAGRNSPARTHAFARLPDWSGMWEADGLDVGVSGHSDNDKAFFTLKFAGHPPYNPAWEAEYQTRLKGLTKTATKGCVIDFPATMESPQPFELIVTPEETVYTAGDGAYRHIYTDGRRHPDDVWPTITGDSIGHWEGQTLVADTIARTAGKDRFLGLAAYSEKAHFSERIRMTGKNALEDQMTIDDPVAFTHPWKVTITYKRVTFINRFDPYYCELDTRIDIKDGQEVIKPAN
jgi:hypothetical protein